MIDLARYLIGIVLVAAIPAAVAYWLVIHPLAPFWRRLGKKIALAVALAPVVGIMAAMGLLRGKLLVDAWGLRWSLAIPGLLLLAFSWMLLAKVLKELDTATMVGVPELGGERGRLLSSGIFGKIRHPRYVQMTIGLTGSALVANYPAVYAMLLVWVAGIWVVVLLEERELRERFGEEYVDYCRRVPRFIPKRRR